MNSATAAGLRNVDRVTAGNLGHSGSSALGHRVPSSRWDHVVVRCHEIPARLAAPCRVGHRPPEFLDTHGTCESAMKAASSARTSAAQEAANLSRSRKRNPFSGRRIGAPVPRVRIGDQIPPRPANASRQQNGLLRGRHGPEDDQDEVAGPGNRQRDLSTFPGAQRQSPSAYRQRRDGGLQIGLQRHPGYA